MTKYILLFGFGFLFTFLLLGVGASVIFPDRANNIKIALSDTGLNKIEQGVQFIDDIQSYSSHTMSGVYGFFSSGAQSTSDYVSNTYTESVQAINIAKDKTVFMASSFFNSCNQIIDSGFLYVSDVIGNISTQTSAIKSSITDSAYKMAMMIQIPEFNFTAPSFNNNKEKLSPNIEVASLDGAEAFAMLEPMAGSNESEPDNFPTIYEYNIEDSAIEAEVVLVPREKTVISSSRDGKIKAINFANGDVFNKGDILLEYECTDIKAEIDVATFEQKLAGEKMLTTSRLYDLQIASKIDKEQASTEKMVAHAKKTLMETKMDACVIRAEFDGRVIKRLANANEYTRTDRVLMEIASTGTLDAEFLMPSIWLRWLNIGAPLKFVIHETGKEYTGEISRIYGEVDPVSQSIQMRAKLDDYDAPLLPGMSGKAYADIMLIREAGIVGFLETRQ